MGSWVVFGWAWKVVEGSGRELYITVNPVNIKTKPRHAKHVDGYRENIKKGCVCWCKDRVC